MYLNFFGDADNQLLPAEVNQEREDRREKLGVLCVRGCIRDFTYIISFDGFYLDSGHRSKNLRIKLSFKMLF